MKRLGRLRLLLGLLVLVVAALGCAKLYLSSNRASNQITRKLEEIFGVPVRVGAVDVGIQGDSTLSGLQLFEADGERSDTPWLTVQNVRTDLSLLDVVRGDTSPQRVELTGAAVDLRFDENGHLLTRLPRIKPTGKPYPQLILHDARLTLNQQGRPPMVIEGVNAEGSDDEGTLAFHGTVKDPYWGDWAVKGSFKAAEGRVMLNLKTQHTHVTQKKLEDLPFVSPSVWKQVKLEGDTPVDLDLQFTVGKPGVHYRIELQPTDTTVDVTSIHLHAERASGSVVVEDRVVTLRDVRGTTADGTIHLNHSVLNFSQPAYDMTFEVAVSDVDLRKLPPSWKISIPDKLAKLNPRLRGDANLRVVVKDGKAHTSGTGEGVIKPIPITLSLHADEKGFHFRLPTTLFQFLKMPS
jgi:hypothetical protein